MSDPNTAKPENRLTRIERGIDREMANSLPISRSSGGTFTIAPQSMGELLEFSKLMSLSDFCVRPAFRGNPGACLAVALQAFRCGGDPFAWANKAYITKNRAGEEQISYESQLIHAVVVSSGVLQRRLRPVYEGEGGKRRCRIVGYIKGESEPFEYESPRVEEIAVKNSPLWQADRDQQLFYYATRAWARRHVPEILLGIYAPEDMGEVLDMPPEPEPQRGDYLDHAEPEPEPEMYAVIALDGEGFGFETLAGAIDAVRVILESGRRGGAKMLEAAIENNEALIAAALENGVDLLNEFRPTAPVRTEAPAPVPFRAQPGPAASPPPEPASAPPAPGPVEEEGYPGSLVPRRDPTPPADARPVTPASSPPAGTPASGTQRPSSSGPTAPTPASPSEQPERKNMAVSPPLARGRPDWRTWARALMIPKVRQQTTDPDLAYLLGDNEDNILQCRAAAPGDMLELDTEIEAAWKRLRP